MNHLVSDDQTNWRSPVAWLLQWPIRLYRLIPRAQERCRFHPTCSAYGLEALRVHGVLRGGYLTTRRLLRCHPWGGMGIDPVPPAGQFKIKNTEEYKDNRSHGARRGTVTGSEENVV